MIVAGGTWGTRYYAVRATRLRDEMAAGSLSVRCCIAADVVADALTKLCAAMVLEMARRAMEGRFPLMPGADKVVQVTDQTWWAALLLAPRPDITIYRCTDARVEQTSTTPGRTQQGDEAGDGPVADERREKIWKVIVEIWIKNRSPNASKSAELKRKYYHNTDMFYRAICERYGMGMDSSLLTPAHPAIPDEQGAAEEVDELPEQQVPPDMPGSPRPPQPTQQPPEGHSTSGEASQPEQPPQETEGKRKKRRGAKRRYTGDQRTQYRWKALEAAERNEASS